ncbi:hypothetical protein [Acinetobacter baumannii]|uniref:hypothetical protein n=1 Tax=Acinetobacter baumannii TaxID=470 RepID=UPI0022EA5EB7|nr:hypothetical protein [Acinetobacter baumannii]MCZ3286753.1 hypothetical protein [Acinetobacter baumannii]MDA3520679.1 hypothetical protein [Acinetobacter baumannii]MDA3529418.1 hypothetical protein [Acinetobacter baumannii]
MSNVLINSVNIVKFPRPCTLCDARENVQLFAGLMVCEQCLENIQITNPGMFAVNDSIEQNSHD